jgi:hypothetical protein
MYISVNNGNRSGSSKQTQPPPQPQKDRQKGGSWWPEWIAPKPTQIIHSYNQGIPPREAGKTKKSKKQKVGVIFGGQKQVDKQMAWIKRKFT